MEGKIKEGIYHSKLEIILEDKYFIPIEFDANFQIDTKVVAEIVQKETLKENNKFNEATVQKVQASFLGNKKYENVQSSKFENIKIKSLKEKYK